MPLYREAIYERIKGRLQAVYGSAAAESFYPRLIHLVESAAQETSQPYQVSQRDVVLIAYGDHLRRDEEAPLATLHSTLKRLIGETINALHILPFYPYSSDDGFSVIDYAAVDPALGTWDDITALHADFRLMFDAVFNHISSQSVWFQAYLRSEAPYKDYFIEAQPVPELALVTRPRTLPLLTPVETALGTRSVWTTFSPDQVDLNFANPEVLLDIIRILLFYVARGADLLRLDAIAFLWKEIGTTCIHLPQTHEIIRLMRDILDLAAPGTLIITETNVPHTENISYFGDGTNEAQMVYQFPLPPLVLHTLHTGDTSVLTAWAATIQPVSQQATFFNFTASHDGIGMRPTAGLLSDTESAALVALATAHGGNVSYRSLPDGGQSPYELNITYFDAITDPAVTAQESETAVRRFIVSQAIMLAMVGVPGIYLHSLFGSRNYTAGVAETGRYRTINREKLNADALIAALNDPSTIPHQVFAGYMRLLRVRTAEPAFDPYGSQQVYEAGKAVFGLERISSDGVHRLLTLHNVTGQPVPVTLPAGEHRDLLTGIVHADTMTLEPYQVAWLKLGNTVSGG